MTNQVFPECLFFVELDGGGPLLGADTEGVVRLRTEAPIPRAKALTARFVVSEEAVEDAHEHPEHRRRIHYERQLSFPIPNGLAAGEHRFPFVLTLPASLPQPYAGAQDQITYTLDLRLDVDWALDPTHRVAFEPRIAPLAPVRGEALALRPPPHEGVAVEMTLASSVVAQGEPLDVRVAVRSDRDRPLEQLRLVLCHRCVATTFGSGAPVREREARFVDLPVEKLRSGETVSVRLRTDGLPFDQRTSMLALSSVLRLTLRPKGVLSTSATWDVDIVVVPRGTVVEPAASRPAIGSDRLRATLRDLAVPNGLALADHGARLEGRDGPVRVVLSDAAGLTEHGARVELGFPALGLGLEAKPAALLGGLVVRATPETPATFASRLAIVVVPESPHLTAAMFRGLVETACEGLTEATELGLSDEALGYRERLPSDDSEVWAAVVARARAKARALREAIAELPLGAPSVSREAWEATAREEEAIFVPSRPALVGLERSVRTLTGEPRVVRATLGTMWDGDRPLARLEVEVVSAALPASPSLDGEAMVALRALLPEVEVVSRARFVASGAPLPADPRVLLPALDAALRWVLEARGERAVVAPYR